MERATKKVAAETTMKIDCMTAAKPGPSLTSPNLLHESTNDEIAMTIETTPEPCTPRARA